MFKLLPLTKSSLTTDGFQARSQNYEERLLASLCLFVGPSFRVEQLGSHCTDFHEVLFEYFSKIYRENSDFIKT
jgi:hypothetical protein